MTKKKGEPTERDRTTSGNREESMTESGDDAFGRESSARNAGGTKEKQNPRSSGTVPLGGESPDSEGNKGPGGVEGAE